MGVLGVGKRESFVKKNLICSIYFVYILSMYQVTIIEVASSEFKGLF